MKANELRIGNYIGFGNINQIERVEIIKEQSLGVYSDCEFDTLTPIGLFEPIPLTEEWLLKLGFEKKLWQYNNFYCREKWTIEVNPDGYSVHNNYDRYLITIIYVHQLQNLYFVFTGEELTIVQP